MLPTSNIYMLFAPDANGVLTDRMEMYDSTWISCSGCEDYRGGAGSVMHYMAQPDGFKCGSWEVQGKPRKILRCACHRTRLPVARCCSAASKLPQAIMKMSRWTFDAKTEEQ